MFNMRTPRNRMIPVLIGSILLAVLLFVGFYTWLNKAPDESPAFGVTYSLVYADKLGIDWQEAYLAMLDDLNVRYVRIPVYWSDVERDRNAHDFTRVDWLMEQSEARDVNVTLVVGQKVPRWPECFIPDWAEVLDDTYRQNQLMEFIETTVTRYRESTALVRWQVENEPFFSFGICPTITPTQLRDEVALVRSLDTRPIQVTVSGELETWLDAAKLGDVLGVSMYRVTWNKLFGYFYYPITPGFYRLHAQVVAPFTDKVIVSELQAEPWFPEAIPKRTSQEWLRVFDAEMLERNISFARRTGMSEVYLWGAEWWYYLKQDGEDALWNAARDAF